jgi:hypothetical protein
MAEYILRDLSYPLPYSASDVKMFGFVFEADHDKLVTLINDALNLEANDVQHYYPVSHYVMVTFVDLGRSVATTPPYNGYGYFVAREVDFWVLTAGMKKILGEWVIDPLLPAFYCPFIFPNNPLAISVGREIYGYPKQQGDVNMPTDPHNIDQPFTLDTLAIQKFSPDSLLKMERLLDITPSGDVQATREDWTSTSDIFKHGSSVLPGWAQHVETDLEGLFDIPIPQVLLKNFRAADSTTEACYQAVVEYPAEIERFSGGGLLHGDFNLTLNHYDSLPIADLIGLNSQKSLFQFWMNIDMNLPTGKVVWRADINNG